jgi:hypothetical protein
MILLIRPIASDVKVVLQVVKLPYLGKNYSSLDMNFNGFLHLYY